MPDIGRITQLGLDLQRPLELGVVVPTYNEVDNVRPLAAGLERVLSEISWEVVFVDDDSVDRTAEMVRQLASVDRRIRILERVGRRGLASAVVEGMLASAAPVLAVIDADMQHDETILPALFRAVLQDDYDIAIGSRYIAGGSVTGWHAKRQVISRVATRLACRTLRTPLSDPMSGFFVISRRAFVAARPRLSSVGFKIMLDLIASSPAPLRIKEIPYKFRPRLHGESKLDSGVAWEYIVLLLDKLLGRFVPVRFLLFAIVGALGLLVHLAVLGTLLDLLGLTFIVAQALAVLVAMTSNFVVNNQLTYRDKRLSGLRLLTGLISFYAVCLVGATANVGVGAYIYERNWTWWAAGAAGALVGAVWNYAVSAVYTWRR